MKKLLIIVGIILLVVAGLSFLCLTSLRCSFGTSNTIIDISDYLQLSGQSVSEATENLSETVDKDKLDSHSMSTPDLINMDFQEGKISKGEQLLYMAYALGDFEKLPNKYHGNAPWHGTLPLLDLHEDLEDQQIVCAIEPDILQKLNETLDYLDISCQ